MKYCIKTCRFEFNPTKYSTVEQAYYDQDQNDAEIIALFDDIDSAKLYLKSFQPDFTRYSYRLASAVIYTITECDWYFDDDYYDEPASERSFADLETFDDVVFLSHDME